jgi:hypothetical protein
VVISFHPKAIEIASWTDGPTLASVCPPWSLLEFDEMPKNGETNQTFGIYRSLCCGREIIIRAGAAFPDCSNHPNLSTVWKPIEIDVEEVVIKKKAKAEPAA